MITLPLAQVKNQLSELINLVERGETIAVTRRGKPVAQLVMYPDATRPDQAEKVTASLGRLKSLRNGMSLDGDLKSIAREGLA